MREGEDRDRAGSTLPFSADSFLKWLPWGLVGLVLIGSAMVTMSAGFPWETKEHAADQRALTDQQMQSLAKSQETATAQIASLAKSVADLTNLIATFQGARAQEKEDRDKRMADHVDGAVIRHRAVEQ